MTPAQAVSALLFEQRRDRLTKSGWASITKALDALGITDEVERATITSALEYTDTNGTLTEFIARQLR